MINYFKEDLLHPNSRHHAWQSAVFLLMGKFVGLLSPFILRNLVNTMTNGTKLTGTVFWKAGVCVMLYGAAKAMSTIYV